VCASTHREVVGHSTGEFDDFRAAPRGREDFRGRLAHGSRGGEALRRRERLDNLHFLRIAEELAWELVRPIMRQRIVDAGNCQIPAGARRR
jgi:hypothetical protein